MGSTWTTTNLTKWPLQSQTGVVDVVSLLDSGLWYNYGVSECILSYTHHKGGPESACIHQKGLAVYTHGPAP